MRGASEPRPRDTVLVTELGNPRSYPWFRHVMYYLPEYATYHLRLNAAAPGYLASRELPSMAAVAERRVPLPVTTRRLVWVVDEWDPTAPRPAGLEARRIGARVDRGHDVARHTSAKRSPELPTPVWMPRRPRAARERYQRE